VTGASSLAGPGGARHWPPRDESVPVTPLRVGLDAHGAFPRGDADLHGALPRLKRRRSQVCAPASPHFLLRPLFGVATWVRTPSFGEAVG